MLLNIKNPSSGSLSGEMAMPSKKWSDIAAEEDDLQSINAGAATGSRMMRRLSMRRSSLM